MEGGQSLISSCGGWGERERVFFIFEFGVGMLLVWEERRVVVVVFGFGV